MTRSIRIDGSDVDVTPAYDSYWSFACERQAVFFRRLRDLPAPWTTDEIIRDHRFTNPYRVSDRVSQYLIRHVINDGDQSPSETLFRILIFKLFNKIDTWRELVMRVGVVSWRDFDRDVYVDALDDIKNSGAAIYSAAYMMPSPRLGEVTKHADHLKLIEYMMVDDMTTKVLSSASLQDLYNVIMSYPSMGRFLSFQMAIDINYSRLTSFDEDEFVVAGPGADDGVSKCFASRVDPASAIREMAARADDEFAQRGMNFQSLFGRRLKLIDCQNLFCELSKYARLAHPTIAGVSGRTNIKQRYKSASAAPLDRFCLPSKWGCDAAIENFYREVR